jgi:subtilase family serine protease
MQSLGRWCKFVSVILIFHSLLAHTQQPRQTLTRHVRLAVSNGLAKPVGRLASIQRLNLSIVLPLRNQQLLTAFLSHLYDPSSPDYRHFLSVAEFTEQYGPSARDYQAVVEFATAQGFSVNGSPANRLVVPVSGTVEQIQNAFDVSMKVYRHPTENRTFFSPDREPSIPSNLPVSHIAGMDDFSIPQASVRRPQSNGAMSPTVKGSGPGGSYLGSDMRAAYYGGTALTGSGQTVALVQFDGYDISDVTAGFNGAATWSTNGTNYVLHYTPPSGGTTYTITVNNVLLDGASGSPESGDDAEETLDIVQSISMAPGLSQVRVYIGNLDADVLNQVASDDAAKQVSISWTWSPDDPDVDDFFFEEMAAQGQSVFVASGDYGAYQIDQPYFFPAEDAFVTAVGGTSLVTSGPGGTWLSEAAWNRSGGGISADFIPIPSWQAGVANSANQGSATYRNVPDVAMESDFDNYNCDMGACQEGWGARVLLHLDGRAIWPWSASRPRSRESLPSGSSTRCSI